MRTSIITICCLLAGMALAQGFLEEGILNRKKSGYATYPVYIISNLPERTVVPVLRGSLDVKRDHLRYLPLSAVGRQGRRKRDLLPNAIGKNTEYVVVIDASVTLADEDAARLVALREALFPGMPDPPAEQVFAFAHSVIRAKDEFQVYLQVPQARWLPLLRADLSATLPDLTSGVPYTFEQAITRTLVLTNDPQARALLTGTLRYDDLQSFTLDDFAAFRDAGPADRRILAVNWNGDEEITPAMAVQVLPAPLRPRCAEQTPDRMGITGWQRFCRLAFAQRFDEDDGMTWVIAAPTAAYLRALAVQVMRNRFLGGPYRVDLCDLSYVDKLSVGVYLATPDVDRDRLVLQQRMEEVAGGILRSKVRSMVSTQNWGQTLQEALGQDPDTDNPFRRPESLNMVNQASNSDAVLLLWVKTLSPKVAHDMTSRRLTKPYPAFSEREPQPPDPGAREYAIFGPHIYPGETDEARRQSAEYRQDYRDYEEEHDRWERRQWEWEREAENYRVNYEFTVTARPSVALSGYLKLLDLKGAQRILWSTEVELARTGNSYALKTIPVQVVGEGRDPRQPEIRADYQDAYTWTDCTRAVNGDAIYGLGQTALLDSLRDGVYRLSESALWASDLKPWNQPVKRVRE